MSIVDFMFTDRQQRMLSALLLHPEREYGTNELIAVGGAGSGAGKRILDHFKQAGIVCVTIRGNQRLYTANTAHPIYPDLRSICIKTFGLADVISEELRPFQDRIHLAFVFGSIARRAERPDSDVNLMVIGNLAISDIIMAIENMHAAFGRRIDLNLHTLQEWNDLRTDPVIKSILRSETIAITGGEGA